MSEQQGSTKSFSLVEGGPLYRFLVANRLVAPGRTHLVRRAVLAVLLTWVPTIVLAALHGAAIGHGVKVPYLHDLAEYARYLVALPLMIFAAGPIGGHMSKVATHFGDERLVPEANHKDFESAVAAATRQIDSTLAGVVILGLTVATIIVSTNKFPFEYSTWRSTVSTGG